MDVSQLSSNVSKRETEEQENDSHQHEQDHEYGDEVFAVKGKGKGGFQRDLFQVWNGEDTRLIDAGRKEKGKEARETGRKERDAPKERDGPKEQGQTLVTRGTVLGTIPLGTAKRTVLRWMRGHLLNLFHISLSLNSSCEEFSEPKRMSKGTRIKTSKSVEPMGFRSREQILNFCARRQRVHW